MKLYVCWGTFQHAATGRPSLPQRLRGAEGGRLGPEVQKTYGWAALGNA